MKPLLFSILGCLVLSPAFAHDRVVIDYSDLDLARPAGADVLYRRIESAANVVCTQSPLGDIHRFLIWRSCFQSTIARAVEKVDSPQLTARHRRVAPPELYSSRAPAK